MTTHASNRILVIDDNRAIHDDFRKILCPASDSSDQAEAEFFGGPAPPLPQPHFRNRLRPFKAMKASPPCAARSRKAGRIAMAFVDVRMPPGIDGIETAGRLWQLSPELQVVICTAYSDYSWEEMVGPPRQARPAAGAQETLCRHRGAAARLRADRKMAAHSRCARSSRGDRAHRRGTHPRTSRNERDASAPRWSNVTRSRTQLLRAQRLESIGTLASGIAHDLNNMLSPILMVRGLAARQPAGGLRGGS